MNGKDVAKGGRGPIWGTIPGSWSPVSDSQVRIPWIYTGSDAHPTGLHDRQDCNRNVQRPSTGNRWWVSFASRPIYLPHPLNRSNSAPRRQSECFAEDISCLCPELKPDTRHPARTNLTYPQNLNSRTTNNPLHHKVMLCWFPLILTINVWTWSSGLISVKHQVMRGVRIFPSVSWIMFKWLAKSHHLTVSHELKDIQYMLDDHKIFTVFNYGNWPFNSTFSHRDPQVKTMQACHNFWAFSIIIIIIIIKPLG